MPSEMSHPGKVDRFPSERGQATHFRRWSGDRGYLRVLDSRRESSLWEILQKRGRRPDDKGRNLAARKGKKTPWLTFVLGSGCLTAADVSPDDLTDAEATLTSIRQQLSRDLSDLVAAYPNLELDGLAARFLELLTLERTGAREPTEAFATVVLRDDVQPPEHSARVALAAALATQLYAAALGASPLLQPADREVVRFDSRSARGLVVNAEILEPLKVVLDRLSTADGDGAHSAQQALSVLAREIAVSISGGRIRRFHVELLTAFAWYYFTAGTRVYPGWAELMLLASLEDSSWFQEEVVTADSAEAHLRPRITSLQGQHDWVRARIVEVTNNSWRSRLAKAARPTARDGFYDLVASFLAQQASAPLRAKPAAVCFVTSFDLELEMALWDAGEPFVVILPVYALDEEFADSVSLHWIWTTVTPGGSPESASGDAEDAGTGEPTLTLPRGLWNPGGWRLADPELYLNVPGKGKSTPFVVRLAGSPLMTLPSPSEMLPQPTEHTLTLHHALLLDEYAAVQQAHQDLKYNGKDALAPTGALPPFLSSDEGPSRSWVLLGTQLGDPAVRLRMTAHQVSHRARRGGPKTESARDRARQEESSVSSDTPAPSSADATNSQADETDGFDDAARLRRTSGIVINAMSQISDRELFLWQDFDVVDGRHTDLVDSLRNLLADIGRHLDEVAETLESDRAARGDEAS